jgi:crotonobetainyl-CoA:carnitine CoA-transferase CaiB-like acyl-CoA transferase
LAGLGADVLRIDPPDWDEPPVVLITGIGKRAARLDARTPVGRERLYALLAGADVLVHGYRDGALAGLGLGASDRRRIRPGLVDVALTAYGQSGPWSGRRGFDSLVQMSAGIADTGMRAAGSTRPVPLPVQALDYATGNVLAAAVLAGLRDRVRNGTGSTWRTSLARVALELERARGLEADAVSEPPQVDGARLQTGWGPVDLFPPPISVEGVDLGWTRGSYPLGTDEPQW